MIRYIVIKALRKSFCMVVITACIYSQLLSNLIFKNKTYPLTNGHVPGIPPILAVFLLYAPYLFISSLSLEKKPKKSHL